MIAIRKGSPPDSLIQYRARVAAGRDSLPRSAYDDFPDKQELREALHREQGGICCYCMRRIHATETSMKIEHWESRSAAPEKQLDYSNLLGACTGVVGSQVHDRTCDTRKGGMSLSRNPSNTTHRVEDCIDYGPDGSLSSTIGPAFQAELGLSHPLERSEHAGVLNLNHPRLIASRLKALRGFREAIPEGTLSKSQWEAMLKKVLSADAGVLDPFCGIVIRMIEKKLKVRRPL